MPDLNKESIIYGTPKKAIRLAFETMKENPCLESAEKFFEVYRNYEIPVLLENSRYIFAEPEIGNSFYRTMMESGCVPFVEYLNERDKIKSFMMEHDHQMNDSTKEWYRSLYEFVDDLFQKHKNCAVAEASLEENRDCVYQFLTEAYRCKQGRDNRDALLLAYRNLSPMAQVLYTAECATALDLEYELIETMSGMHANCVATESMNEFSNGMHLIMLLNRMGKDAAIQEAVQQYENKHLKSVFKGLVQESVPDVLMESVLNHLEDKPIMDATVFETVNNILELQVEDTDGFYEEYSHIRQYDNILRQYIVYENCLSDVMSQAIFSAPDDLISGPELVREYAISKGYDPDTVTISDATTLVAEAVAELGETLTSLENMEYMREYRADGKQTSLIRKHATTLKEEDNPKAEKNNKPDQWKANTKEESDGDDVANEVNAEEEKKSDSEKPGKSEEKPTAPKQSFHTKVQAKALEADMKTKAVGGKLKKFATDVKQTGKTILKVPGNLVNGVKSLISGWNSWNEDRKKEEILKPGFRKGYWAKFRATAQYGLAFAIHPLFVILTFMTRHASKEKNKYLRNELALELQTEIKVVDAKIEDASRDENPKAKYQLMRIRDKLEKERVRVISNSKYV